MLNAWYNLPSARRGSTTDYHRRVKDQSSKWQQLAEESDEKFESALAGPVETASRPVRSQPVRIIFALSEDGGTNAAAGFLVERAQVFQVLPSCA